MSDATAPISPSPPVSAAQVSASPQIPNARDSSAREAPKSAPKPRRGRTSDLLARLWRDWMRKHWRMLALNLLAIAAFAGASALYPPGIQQVIDALTTGDVSGLSWILPIILGAVALKAASLYAHKLLTSRILARIETELQVAMYGRLIDADMTVLAREAPAASAARFTADIALARQVIEKLINSLLRDLLMVIGLIGAMFYIDWELTLLGLAVFPLAVWPLVAIGRRLRKISRDTQKRIGSTTALVQESLAGAQMAKTHRIEDYLKSNANHSFEALRRLKVRAADQRAIIDPLMEVLGGVAVALVLYYVGSRIEAGVNTLGDIAGFIAALLIAAQPMRALGNLNAQVQQGLAGVSRIFAVLDAPRRVVDRPQAPPLRIADGRIRLENVTFHYEDADAPDPVAPAALEGLSFEAEGGARIALVGRSGAGKSTVFNLLPRLYDVGEGRVTIDDQDIRDVTLASLRDAIAFVGQDAIIFNDTIRRNIAFGRPGADMEAIEAAARDAAAHDFIMSMPEGYDTLAGERGDRLSGGQRQRLSIARAFLRDAPILLLDEPTSALDAESESAIRGALDRLAQGRTTLIIAHRLATVMDADKIVVLDDGQVVETGAHRELVDADGLYASLYRLQFGEG